MLVDWHHKQDDLQKAPRRLRDALKETGRNDLARKVAVSEEDDLNDSCSASNSSGTPVSSSASACALKPETEVGELNLARAEAADGDSTDETKPRKLRSYQKELVAAALGGRNCLVVAPTGSGKTIVAARLVKAFLNRELGVGPRSGNPPEVMVKGSNKAIFLVNKVSLVEQQRNVLQEYMSDSSIFCLSGEMSDFGPLSGLLEENDILVMTAQILVNALQGDKEDNDRMELCKIGLLILDECHHCQKGDPYNKIMAQYCDLKLSSPETPRPQVLGLTASVGVGKARTDGEAEAHIMEICANLDVEEICTVQNPENKIELQLIRDKPEEDIFEVPGRKNNSYMKEIIGIMEKIELQMSQTQGGQDWNKLSTSVPKRGTQAYENWLDEMGKYIIENFADEHEHRKLMTRKDHLKEYNASLYINRDARTQDALDHFTSFLESLESRTIRFNQDEQQLVDLFKDKLPGLKELATSQDSNIQNPLLECLAKILIDSLRESPDSRGILFCKTRATTKALQAWLEATPGLKFLQAGILTGSGGSEGMTQTKQEKLLSMFREGKHRLIVATSVAEEGLDIQQCNIVIRCNYISNEIGRVQAKGRSRARCGKFYLVVSEELRFTSREFRNRFRENLMNKATESLHQMQKKDKDKFLERIVDHQKRSQTERQVGEKALARLQHNKVLMDVRLLCRKCSQDVCTLDDIRCIENAHHHVVLNESFMKRCKLVPHKKPIKKVDFEKLKRVLCGDKTCSQEWGIQMNYKGCIVFALTPVNFVFQTEKGKRRTYQKWKAVNYKIAQVTIEELSDVRMEYEEDSADETDDLWTQS